MELPSDKSNMSESSTTQVFTDWSSNAASDHVKESFETNEDVHHNPFNDDLNNFLESNSKVDNNTSDLIDVMMYAEDENITQQFSIDNLNINQEFVNNEDVVGCQSEHEEKSDWNVHPTELLDNDVNFGPETCVDVTDDVVMITENSADTNLLEHSTLSNSKDTIPSSDNYSPFDNKNVFADMDANEFPTSCSVQFDIKNSPTLSVDDGTEIENNKKDIGHELSTVHDANTFENKHDHNFQREENHLSNVTDDNMIPFETQHLGDRRLDLQLEKDVNMIDVTTSEENNAQVNEHSLNSVEGNHNKVVNEEMDVHKINVNDETLLNEIELDPLSQSNYKFEVNKTSNSDVDVSLQTTDGYQLTSTNCERGEENFVDTKLSENTVLSPADTDERLQKERKSPLNLCENDNVIIDELYDKMDNTKDPLDFVNSKDPTDHVRDELLQGNHSYSDITNIGFNNEYELISEYSTNEHNSNEKITTEYKPENKGNDEFICELEDANNSEEIISPTTENCVNAVDVHNTDDNASSNEIDKLTNETLIHENLNVGPNSANEILPLLKEEILQPVSPEDITAEEVSGEVKLCEDKDIQTNAMNVAVFVDPINEGTPEANELGDQQLQHRLNDSCDESEEDEWKYMQIKEGLGEKQAEVELQKDNTNATIEREIEKVSEQESPEQINENITQGSDIKQIEEFSESLLQINQENIGQEENQTSIDPMNSQLNPNAKEFIPTFSPPANENVSNGFTVCATPRHILDEVVSQSPRKGRESNMENISVPTENEFGQEISSRPHEWVEEPIADSSAELYQEINLKEAMHACEKEEPIQSSENENTESANLVKLIPAADLENADMKQSIYIENTSYDNEVVDVLNSIQPIPNFLEDDMNNTSVEVLTTKEDLSLGLEEKDIISPATGELIEPNFLEKEVNVVTDITRSVEGCPQLPINGIISSQDDSLSEVNLYEKKYQGSSQTETSAPKVEIFNVENAQSSINESVINSVNIIEAEKNKKNDIRSTTPNKVTISSKTLTKVPEVRKSNEVKKGPLKLAGTTLTGPKKIGTTSAGEKTKTLGATTLTVKSKMVSTTSTKPRTTPLVNTAQTTKSLTEKRTITPTTSQVKPKIDLKGSTLGTRKPLAPKPSKVVEDSKVGVTRPTTAKIGTTARTIASSSRLISATKARPATANASVSIGTTKPLSGINPVVPTKCTLNSKLSPRSTLPSTLRKTEALKSPTKSTTTTTTTSRLTSGTKLTSATRTTTKATTSLSGVTKPTTTTTVTRKSNPIKKIGTEATSAGKTLNAKPIALTKKSLVSKSSPISKTSPQVKPSVADSSTEDVDNKQIVDEKQLNGSAIAVLDQPTETN